MLAYHIIDLYLRVEIRDNKIRGHWFWNGVLLHIITWDLGKCIAEHFFSFFCWQKRTAFKCSLDQWPVFLCLLDSLDQTGDGSESHT